MTRVLAALLLAGIGFLASWILLPIRRIEVAGARRLAPGYLVRAAGLYAGGPWLYRPPLAARLLAQNPWVAAVRVTRPGLGTVRIEVRERRPLALLVDELGVPGGRRLGLVVDGEGRPLPAPTAPVAIRGREPGLSAALALARRFPRARQITYGPAGYGLDLKEGRYWAAKAEELAALARVPGGAVHAYAWGVSVRR